MLQTLTKKRGDEGFTLIELLVVIVILGILAAVVVFAVGGITDKGQASACKSDTKTLRTAEEANYAKLTAYDTMANLKAHGFLGETSTLHDIANIVAPNTTTGTPGSYDVIVKDSKCGDTTAGSNVVGTGSNI